MPGTSDCPAVHDCSLSEWEPASACPTCGPPFDQTWIRKIVSPASGGGKPCRDFPVIEKRSCNVESCALTTATCLYGSWPTTKEYTGQTAAQAMESMQNQPNRFFFESLPLEAQVEWSTALGAEETGRFMGGSALPDDLAAALNSGANAGATFLPTGSASGYVHRSQDSMAYGKMQMIPHWYCDVPFYYSNTWASSYAEQACLADPKCQGFALNTGDSVVNLTSVTYEQALAEGRCSQDMHYHDWFARSTPALRGGWWPTGSMSAPTMQSLSNFECYPVPIYKDIVASTLEDAVQQCLQDPACKMVNWNNGLQQGKLSSQTFAEARALGKCTTMTGNFAFLGYKEAALPKPVVKALPNWKCSDVGQKIG